VAKYASWLTFCRKQRERCLWALLTRESVRVNKLAARRWELASERASEVRMRRRRRGEAESAGAIQFSLMGLECGPAQLSAPARRPAAHLSRPIVVVGRIDIEFGSQGRHLNNNARSSPSPLPSPSPRRLVASSPRSRAQQIIAGRRLSGAQWSSNEPARRLQIAAIFDTKRLCSRLQAGHLQLARSRFGPFIAQRERPRTCCGASAQFRPNNGIRTPHFKAPGAKMGEFR